MASFDHERLEVYQLTLDFVALVEDIVKTLPPGQSDRIDQLRRASTSQVLNIAEGAGEFSKREKCRFYRMARRSGTECAGVLDIFRRLRIGDAKLLDSGRSLLVRIVSMLVRLIHTHASIGPGSGKGTDRGTGTGEDGGQRT